MKHKITKLIELAKRYDESVKKIGEVLQQIKKHNKKYEYNYTRENYIPRKQTIK